MDKLCEGAEGMSDHPNTRALPVCIVCRKPKYIGALICWPCHKKQKHLNWQKEYDYDPVITEIMDAFEGGKVAIDNAGNITIELIEKGEA
jgi:hypothetical protein